jgi:hypothetical protein
MHPVILGAIVGGAIGVIVVGILTLRKRRG